ncbi:hypothetical protein QL285_008986 [Trifolium repens]|nr:hypothetical protein QL285_008986 [Trifolium repens]
MIIQTSYLIPIDISVCSTIPQWPHPLDNPITKSRLVMNSPEGHPILSSKDIPIRSLLAILYQSTSTRPYSTPPGDNDPCKFKFIEFLPRILCGSRSPQVHPPRTTLSKGFRDTCRLNSTKARGFTIPLTEASLLALLR